MKIFWLILAAAYFFLPLDVKAQTSFAGAGSKAAQKDARSSEVQFGYASESLTNNYGAWGSATLDFSHRFGKRRILYSLRRNRRDRAKLRSSSASGCPACSRC